MTEQNAITQLTSLALLKVNGADTKTFLQGQLTADVTQLQNNWNFAGYCSPKGRLLAIFKLWQQQDDYYLLLPTELIDNIQKRLTMFVLRSKVVIENAGVNIYGIIGQKYKDELAQQLNILPANNSTVIYNESHTMINISSERCLVISSNSLLDNKTYQQQPESLWLDTDIEDGHGQVFSNTSDMFVPQMMNLDLLEGISFKKGCYTGQEIVARMHYLGKLKQRMYKIQLTSITKSSNTKPINIGDAIQNQDGKNAGTIVQIQQYSNTENSNTAINALAVMRKESLKQKLMVNNSEVYIDETTQPYSIE